MTDTTPEDKDEDMSKAAPEKPEDTQAEAAQSEAEEPSLEEQLATLNDKFMRALAELENTRRRAERERSEAAQFGMMKFARDMLSVLDNLQRAQAAVSEEQKQDMDAATQSLLEGVATTERALLQIFESYKIKAIEAEQAVFDPNIHEAMFEAPHPDAPEGTIIDVIEHGYMIGDKLLRPARVGIAKKP